MSVAAYHPTFHSLLRYATQSVTTEEERICLFTKELNDELQVLSVHMNSVGRTLKVINFVKKVKGLRRVG